MKHSNIYGSLATSHKEVQEEYFDYFIILTNKHCCYSLSEYFSTMTDTFITQLL